MQKLDNLLADPVQVGAEADKHLGGDALALTDQAEQDVLRADVVVAKLKRLPQGQLKHLLGPRRERDVTGRRLLALADDLLNLLPYGFEAYPQRLKCLSCNAFSLVDEAQQDVLSADVVVVEHPGLFLCQHHNPPRPVGKPLEHLVAPHSAVGEAPDLPRPFRMLARVPGGAMACGVPHYSKRSPPAGRSSHST